MGGLGLLCRTVCAGGICKMQAATVAPSICG